MDTQWDEEARALRAHVLDVGRRIASSTPARTHDGRSADADVLRARFRELGALGVLGMPIPSEQGGTGAGVVAAVAALEALGEAGLDGGTLFSVAAQIWAVQMPLLAFGSEAQCARWLPSLCAGERVASIAMSEPDAGSDLFAMRTRAEERGDDRVVVHGRKAWVTNAPIADVFVVLASSGSRATGIARCTAFVIERGTPGLSIERSIDKMGLDGSPMAELGLDGVELSRDDILGRWGCGAEIFEHALLWERGALAAPFVGVMRRQLERCIAYANDRRQFGQPIARFQAVSHRIAEMRVRLETSSLLLHRFAVKAARGEDARLEAAMVKLHVTESFVQSSLDAIQIHGAAGYASELGLEASLRDAIGLRIASGTNDVQRSVIARCMGVG